MSNLQIFQSPEWGSIRTVELDGEPWLVGKDVAAALGYNDAADALKRHVDDEDKQILKTGETPVLSVPNRGLTIINESGLYSLVLASKLPSARRFRRWVTSVVLPSIRKTGSYAAGDDIAAIRKLWNEQAYWNNLAEQFDEVAQECRKQYDRTRAQRDECRAKAKEAADQLTGLMARMDLERALCDG